MTLVRVHKELGERKASTSGMDKDYWVTFQSNFFILDILPHVSLAPCCCEDGTGHRQILNGAYRWSV